MFGLKLKTYIDKNLGEMIENLEGLKEVEDEEETGRDKDETVKTIGT